jgi:hypothetical protein
MKKPVISHLDRNILIFNTYSVTKFHHLLNLLLLYDNNTLVNFIKDIDYY